jgi:lipoprotein-anchoring transpeptidase ErfK/SrfK
MPKEWSAQAMGFVRFSIAATATVLFISSAAAHANIVLAATEPNEPALSGGAAADPHSAMTDVAVTVSPASDVQTVLGHQASDAALPPAVTESLPEEMVKAEPLERPAPTLFAEIDLTNQRMTVSDASGVLGSWKISSARGGYVTPTGTYTVNWTSRMHYSRQYHFSPMPYSVFFNEGVAVHGTNAISNLGRPASHGCVRAHPKDAKKFYDLVHAHGPKLTRIVVHGTPPYTPVVRDDPPRRRYRGPTFEPFAFFGAQPPVYEPRKRRYKRQQYGGGYYGTW